MVFSSNIFLFIFLPVFLLVYLFLPEKLKNPFLLAASIFFYAWGEQWLVLVMLFSAFVDYCSGLLITVSYKKTGLALSIGVNLSILIFYKYLSFFIENFGVFTNFSGIEFGGGMHFMDIVLPLGISFYTFQSMSYTIEIFRGNVLATRKLTDFFCYVAMFPQLVAGPIVRYAQISKELVSRKTTPEGLSAGIWRFTIGLAKKVILANYIGSVADKIFDLPQSEIGSALAWLAALCYTFQIYYDFSGYSDMAIGLGKMLGFNFPENFRQPYRSQSITEFWRRWHITLSSWFKDFVYVPLGGNRKGVARTYVNLIIVFLITGFWHGAAWNFVIWGIYHGCFIILERVFKNKLTLRLPSFLKGAWTFTIVMFGWVLFRSPSLDVAWAFILKMLYVTEPTSFQYFEVGFFLHTKLLVFLIAATFFALFPVEKIRVIDFNKPAVFGIRIVLSVTLFFYSATVLASAGYNPFLYFRF